MATNEILIDYMKGGIPSYFSEPETGSSVGIIIISAIFGVDNDTKNICDRLAKLGFPALAINMFWEDELDSGPLIGAEHERAKARSMRVNREDGNAYVKAAISTLKSSTSCNGKVVVFGFCYGGPYVVEAAAHHAVDGGICFHGSYVEEFISEFEYISCPIQFHYGDNDAIAPMEKIALIEAECKKRENRELFVYADGEHGYMFPNRGSGYHEEAAELSWKRTLDFLRNI